MFSTLMKSITGALTPSFGASLPSISVVEARQRLESGASILVDVRGPSEWAQTGVASGAHRIQMGAPDFVAKLEALRKREPSKAIDLICRSGARSGSVQRALADMGWSEVYNVRGGTSSWMAAQLPMQR